MKRIAMIALVVVIGSLALTSCGIPQEIQDELDALRAEEKQWDEVLMPELEQLRTDKEQWEEDKLAFETEIAEQAALIAELEEEKTALEAEIEELTPQEVELKYDDGTAENFMGVGRSPGTGYIIDFTPPATPFTITKIRIFGKLFGSSEVYENREFTVEIWDKIRRIIWTASYPHTAKFTLDPEWVEIEVPEVTVSDGFYIHLFTNSIGGGGGINIGFDSSTPNEHSNMTKEWRIEWWSMGSSPQSKYNWMIRVVGVIEE